MLPSGSGNRFMPPWSSGDRVQTPFGKGMVREVRNGGRVLVDVRGRLMVVMGHALQALQPAAPAETAPQGSERPETGRSSTVDLHGLTVPEALACAEEGLNAALLGDVAELRFIHGRTGGRIRAALHQWLARIAAVREFRLDPRNGGVTVVTLE